MFQSVQRTKEHQTTRSENQAHDSDSMYLQAGREAAAWIEQTCKLWQGHMQVEGLLLSGWHITQAANFGKRCEQTGPCNQRNQTTI